MNKKNLKLGKKLLLSLALVVCSGLSAAILQAASSQDQESAPVGIERQSAKATTENEVTSEADAPTLTQKNQKELTQGNIILPALPQRVTFYQDGVKIETVQSLTPQPGPNSGDNEPIIVFALPPGTDLSTLRIEGENPSAPLHLGAWSWESQRLDDMLRDTELQKTLQKAEAELLQTRAMLQSVRTRLTLWGSASGDGTLRDLTPPAVKFNNFNMQQQEALLRMGSLSGASGLSASEVEKLDSAINAKIPDLMVKASELSAKVDKLSNRVNELARRVSERLDVSRIGFVVSMRVMDKPSEAVKVKLSYYSDLGGWSPYYRLEALPEQGGIKLFNQARLWQRSGQDWRGAEVVLSSQKGRRSIAPIPMFPWVVRERELAPVNPVPLPRAATMMEGGPMLAKSLSFAAPAPAQSEDSSEPFNSPVSFEQRSTFLLQNLGPMNLMSGIRSTVPVKTDELKAEFFHTLRPAMQNQAFLSARLKRDDNMPQLPEGEADFMVDGSFIGRGVFSLSPQAELFFGADPLVSSDFRLQDRRSGLQPGGKARLELWRWTINVNNGHNYPVSVRVEDPAPIVEPASYKVTVNSTPAPQRERNDFVWNNKIAPNGKFEITHEIQMLGPEKVLVYPGRQ